MSNPEHNRISGILKVVEETTQSTTQFTEIEDSPLETIPDGKVTIQKNGTRFDLFVETKKTIRKHHLPALIEQKQRLGDFIFLAEYIPSTLRQELKKHQINYADSSGNISIDHNGFFVLVEGKQREIPAPKVTRAFSKSGLKVVFALLENPNWVNTDYRTLAAITGVSLDTLSKTFKALVKGGYILKIDKQKGKLNQSEELLNRWAIEFTGKLKPGLHIGNFRFIDQQASIQWKKIRLDRSQTQWGGAPAADILLNDLLPAIWTLYTREEKGELIQKYRIAPDAKGPIKVFQKFWNWTEEPPNLHVSPILVYADLLESGDPRELEMATELYERFIKR